MKTMFDSLEELKAFTDKIRGVVKKWQFLTPDNGIQEFVLHKDHLEQVDILKRRIKSLESEASKEYIKGYDAGRYVGPDYNMRNN